ncbi:MAG: M23 family metallopeptidase [Oscillospiraceae bacterium]|nr:M23 family metallopeptidase [Oscillospiraceae bacterium]
MKKVRFSGLRKFFKGRGFATALVLSITAVGVSAYIAYNSAVNRLSENGGDPDFEMEAAAVENPQGGIPRETEAEAANNPVGVAEEQTEQIRGAIEPHDLESAEEANRFIRPESPKIMPVEGDIINPFSNGELVKSNTLGVWRTHDAVDIAANLGTEVKAMQRGTVSEVYTNAMWGICITIDHGDGVLSLYMGLDKDVKVQEAQEVEAGHVIGLVGNTAEAEIADPPSLHFAVKRNDAWIDPIAYIEERL